uniref:Uncharacterized protein n=1 Tax=Schistocephalus solidus TaxID=70667 RepID=A0A0X3NKU0_SCHSO
MRQLRFNHKRTKRWSRSNRHPTPNTIALKSLSTAPDLKSSKISLTWAAYSQAPHSTTNWPTSIPVCQAFGQIQASMWNHHSPHLKTNLKMYKTITFMTLLNGA